MGEVKLIEWNFCRDELLEHGSSWLRDWLEPIAVKRPLLATGLATAVKRPVLAM